MHQIFVYADSLSWGIIPETRRRFNFDQRWPGIVELQLRKNGIEARVIEDCLNGRRTVWDDPYTPGRNGLEGIEQRVEINSPLSLVVVMLGTNDFQSMHAHNAWQSAQGISAIVQAVRRAPIEPGMPVPPILIVSPPPIQKAKGKITPKFEGAETKAAGLAEAIKQMAEENSCHFFDAGSVTSTSRVDGVHLDEDQHAVLGRALTEEIGRLLS
ncbi:SGNH/GDSL hydrolase family protein [Allopusillimonas ginsengisoli]|uniref:SGNH/GDSL hydrolase family protein n=1 Tax=Allopusillimonas ginsengisoli TaxID=453575 RepID=UPI0010C23153|nr:GDSL family lipase [Allopusillimonas ginsengisoli]